MKTRRRRPARFVLEGKSAVMGKYRWTLEFSVADGKGYMVATRDKDRRRVSIPFDEMIGLAMFYGRDSGNAKQRGREK